MSVGLAGGTMAKRADSSVRIEADVLAEVRIAAGYKGMSVAEYIGEVLRPIARRDIEEGHAKLTPLPKSPPKPKGK